MKRLLAVTLTLCFLSSVMLLSMGQFWDTNGQTPAISCDQSAVVSIAGATTTSIVPVVAGKGVQVCGFLLDVQGAAAANTVQFTHGTGAACTGANALTGAMPGSVTVNVPIIISASHGVGTAFRAPSGSGVCIVTTTADAVRGFVTFAQR